MEQDNSIDPAKVHFGVRSHDHGASNQLHTHVGTDYSALFERIPIPWPLAWSWNKGKRFKVRVIITLTINVS